MAHGKLHFLAALVAAAGLATPAAAQEIEILSGLDWLERFDCTVAVEGLTSHTPQTRKALDALKEITGRNTVFVAVCRDPETGGDLIVGADPATLNSLLSQ